ncbi:bone morphogenetic protein 10-like [Parambassis ranga]|uniref:Bone morphogenetic protein 10-like n=1 Tax=Parambassis ranga TaxID=210632 RepID=A0A6P7JBQ1_9TELE|nr:bone morphogenetic protein 10-like [Parambassis ranga]
MTASILSSLRLVHSLNVLLLVWTCLSSSSPIKSAEKHHRPTAGRNAADNQLFDAQSFLSQFLSTLNLTKLRPHTRPLAVHKEPPEYMLELYERFANDRTAVPSANIVRSFKNEDSSPYSVRARGVRIHPLLFNISIPHHEHLRIAELRLFTLVWKAQRPYSGFDCKVTIYKIHDSVIWTTEMGKEGRGRDKEEVVETRDLEELVTKHMYAKDNSWVSFDLTHVVSIWRKSGCATHRLEVHIASVGSKEEEEEEEEEGFTVEGVVEIDIDRSLDGKNNAVMILFSDDQSRDHKQDKQELNLMIKHENDLPENMVRGQQPLWGHVNPNNRHTYQDEQDQQSLMQLQSNLIYDTPPRVRRNVKSESCKRTPLFVNFKDIGWDTWIIQPLGYEAYECNGVCKPPLTSEVSPTKHAMVQTILSFKSPERTSPACCVPTKLEPISLLFHDNGVVTFEHKYEGMVVAECGCR